MPAGFLIHFFLRPFLTIHARHQEVPLVVADGPTAFLFGRVETVHSFLNQLVGALTLGIYTPMNIKVTCASGSSGEIPDAGADIFVSEDATQADIQQSLQLTAQLAKNAQRPVYVQF